MGNGNQELDDLAGPMQSRAEQIEPVAGSQIEDAAKKLVPAAVKARRKEIDTASGTRFDRDGAVYQADSEVDEADYQWIPPLFRRFYDRTLGAGQDMASALRYAKTALHSGKAEVFNSASDAVNHWGGEARDEFKEYFLDKFPNAIDNQCAVIDDLRAGLFVYEGIQRGGRQEALAIAKATEDALDSLNQCAADSPEAKLGYTVVGVAAWIASAAVGRPDPGVMQLTLVGAGAFLGNGIASYEPEDGDSKVSGGTVEEVLNSMVSKLNALQDTLYDEEEALGKNLTASLKQVALCVSAIDAETRATLLPSSLTESQTADLTDGEVPSREEFRPREQPR